MTCNHGLMRRINRVRILNLLRLNGSLSRIELTREAELDGKTVTNLTRDLMAEKLVILDGYTISSGGRKPELLSLNSDLKHVLGIYLNAEKIIGVLVDLKGKIIKEEIILLTKPLKKDYILLTLKEVIQSLMTVTIPSKVLGLGFAFPGITDIDKNRIVQSANLPSLEGTKIKDYFRENFSLPAEIEDSSRAMALGEKWFGVAKDIENFVLVDLGFGIGCAIVSEGRLHYGASLSSGELGHTVVKTGNYLCHCGHYGCLEAIASLYAIEKEAKDKFKREVSFKELLELAGTGHKKAQKIITNAGHYIGIAISNLINLLNPSHLIISGELSEAEEVLFEAIDETLKKYTVASSYKAVEVIQGKLGEKGSALGAATLILKNVFEITTTAGFSLRE